MLALLLWQNYSLRHEVRALTTTLSLANAVNKQNHISFIKLQNSYKAKLHVLKSSFQDEKNLNSNLAKSLERLRKDKANSCVDLYNAYLLP